MSSESDWPTDPTQYEFKGVIGRGAFAKVFKAVCKTNGKTVAVKKLKLEDSSSSLEDIRKEVLTMKLCDHPNVLSCHCCFNVNDELWIVLPYMAKGSFLRILQHLRKDKKLQDGCGFEEDVVAIIIRETAKGLKYLHDSNLLHRDIKAGNILVDEKGHVCISDLGVARVLEGTLKKGEARTFVGTPCWMAPEVMNRGSYNSAADVWSLGITAMELYKSFPPYAKLDAMEVIIRTIQGQPPSFDTYKDGLQNKPSRTFKNWITAVLEKDPRKRPSIAKVLSNKFLSSSEDDISPLLTILQEIPDLDGKSDKDDLVIAVEKKVNYVPNTTWNFCTEPEPTREIESIKDFGSQFNLISKKEDE